MSNKKKGAKHNNGVLERFSEGSPCCSADGTRICLKKNKKRYICSGYPKISITHSGCYGMRIFLAVREQEVGSQEGA